MRGIVSILIKILELLVLMYFTFKLISKCRKDNLNIVDIIGLRNIRLIDITMGIIIGLVAMLGIFYTEKALGYLNIEGIKGINSTFLSITINIIFAAFFEEFIFRGMMLNGVMAAYNKKYIAIALTAVLFGLAHSSNPHATLISVISNALGGVMYAIAFLEGGIWLSFSLHFAWNFFQGPVLGFPVSGFNMGGMVSQTLYQGHELFNGGYYGPEGGIIGIMFRFAVIIMVIFYCNMKKNITRV